MVRIWTPVMLQAIHRFMYVQLMVRSRALVFYFSGAHSMIRLTLPTRRRTKLRSSRVTLISLMSYRATGLRMLVSQWIELVNWFWVCISVRSLKVIQGITLIFNGWFIQLDLRSYKSQTKNRTVKIVHFIIRAKCGAFFRDQVNRDQVKRARIKKPILSCMMNHIFCYTAQYNNFNLLHKVETLQLFSFYSLLPKWLPSSFCYLKETAVLYIYSITILCCMCLSIS